ncbi:hypothetical protein [Salinimicrobium oceani]|uniref:CarboxypepD_reg-like domain-containing protein n=1 Tax=Salinimicrobium oceani TaxID=2722702 RepID=A0ABX1CZ33_9FLAO|nr:hypothetical protein [Salinimicrobium oceani]NJW51886.1 hypothetical protein [Salinimicrobium oceani]
MKISLSLIVLLISLPLVAQERMDISGKITPPVGGDAEGISVVNRTAKSATISNEVGNFQIKVAAGDTLHFSALQFQNFSVVVDEGVIENRQLNVFISEAVNELPEVVVTPYDLSGNVEVDVKLIPVVETNLPVKTAAEINDYNYTFRPDSLVSPPNAAMREGMIYSGANFANIFRNIFSTRNVTTTIDRQEDIQEEVLQLYDDDFFKERLNIKEENIYEFILFAEDNGLNPAMLQPENEMDLIAFLVAQSQKYKQRKAGE